MKYRIKIITMVNGRKIFYPQLKMRFNWGGLSYEGKVDWSWSYECDSREDALKRIDKHYAGNTKVYTIEFEYITK